MNIYEEEFEESYNEKEDRNIIYDEDDYLYEEENEDEYYE